MPDNETQAFKDNKDGTYSYEVEPGKPTRFVKEPDLLALKESSERKQSEFMSQLAEANRIKDETHQNFLKEKAAKEQFEVIAKEVEVHKAKSTEWENKHKELLAANQKLQEQYLNRTKSHIALMYGVDSAILKDKTMEDLSSIESAYQIVGGSKTAKKPSFDGSAGGDIGGKVTESNDERLDRILTDAKERNRK